jgi:hypothetical protein
MTAPMTWNRQARKIVPKHAKEVHNMSLTREQVLVMAEPA